MRRTMILDRAARSAGGGRAHACRCSLLPAALAAVCGWRRVMPRGALVRRRSSAFVEKLEKHYHKRGPPAPVRHRIRFAIIYRGYRVLADPAAAYRHSVS